MSCCPGQTAPLTARHRMAVRYAGGRSVVVRGPTTGTEYRFSGRDPLQLVDPRDAVQIVRNGPFRVERIVELPISKLSPIRREGANG